MLAMDREEAIGLGTAIGGHVALLAVLLLGIFASKQVLESSPSLEVSLDGFTGPIGGGGEEANVPLTEVEPAAVQDAPEVETQEADSAQQEADAQAAAAQQAEADARRAEEEAKRSNDAAAKRRAEEARKKAESAKRAKVEADRKARERREAQRRAKERAAREAEARRKREEALEKALEEGGGSGRTVGQARGLARTKIAGKVIPEIKKCRISASEPSSLIFSATLMLDKQARFVSAQVSGSPQGITPSNSAQVSPARRCVLSSLKKAAPYNLDPSDYERWKSLPLKVKVNLSPR